jgi:hypothetical protein
VNAGAALEFRIREWRPRENGSLRGFFTIVTPSGLAIRGCSLHEKGGRRWINMPSREWIDKTSQKQYAKFIEFVNRTLLDRFSEAQ